MDGPRHGIQLRNGTSTADEAHQCWHVVHEPKSVMTSNQRSKGSQRHQDYAKFQLGDLGDLIEEAVVNRKDQTDPLQGRCNRQSTCRALSKGFLRRIGRNQEPGQSAKKKGDEVVDEEEWYGRYP